MLPGWHSSFRPRRQPADGRSACRRKRALSRLRLCRLERARFIDRLQRALWAAAFRADVLAATTYAHWAYRARFFDHTQRAATELRLYRERVGLPRSLRMEYDAAIVAALHMFRRTGSFSSPRGSPSGWPRSLS